MAAENMGHVTLLTSPIDHHHHVSRWKVKVWPTATRPTRSSQRPNKKSESWSSVSRWAYSSVPQTTHSVPHARRSQGCSLHVCYTRIPHCRGPRACRQCIERFKSQAYHPSTSSACDPWRRRAGYVGPCDDCWWRSDAIYPQKSDDGDETAAQETGSKPLGSLKNAAPLRASDRRKFKLRVLDAFGIAADIGDELVPNGMRSVKFTTYLDHPGVAYLTPQGDPLWFTLGKDSEELIPSIYTLWKHPDLLPFVATPTSVLPILVAGADLMAPGVIHHSPKIPQDQLVSVRQFNPNDENPVLSPPLAVGRMAVPSDQLSEDAKGKAVLLFHTWKDHLWEMGSKGDIPEPQVQPPTDDLEPCTDDPEPSTNAEPPTYDPQQVTDILLQSLLQAISTLTPSSFPITSTHFYTNYILPCRPALANPNDITIKSSTHKTLTSFLKSAEKASLLTLKTPPKHAQQPDVLVMSVNAAHPNVVGHAVYKTVRDAEKRVVRNETQRDRSVEVSVRVLWKPHLDSVPLFKAMASRSTEKLYTMQEIKTLLNSYIASHNLVNPNVQAYINLDSLLGECIQHRSKKDAAPAPDDSGLLLTEGYMKREELLKKIVDKMQDWYEISREGQVTQKKGTLKPIQVVVKVRQGRKANTFITGFEPFLTVDAETIADDLRRACASATSVSSLPGKRGGTEVMVQGKHAKVVVEYLTSSGAPKPWIQLQD